MGKQQLRDWGISLACVIATVLLSVLPVGGEEGSPLIGYVLDAGHFFFYALCGAAVYKHLPVKNASPVRRLLTATLTGVGLSAALEVIQPSYGRSTSVYDFIASSSGAFFGALLLFPLISPAIRLIQLGAMTWVGVVVLEPAFHEWQSMNLQRSSFPTLATFSDSRELSWWLPVPLSSHGVAASAVYFGQHVPPNTDSGLVPVLVAPVHRKPWRGVMLRLPPNSWEGFKELHLSVYVDVATSLRLRIDDAHRSLNPEDRFSEELQLHPGWNELSVSLESIRRGPQSRELDLKKMKRLFLYTSPETPLNYFLLGEIQLIGESA